MNRGNKGEWIRGKGGWGGGANNLGLDDLTVWTPFPVQ